MTVRWSSLAVSVCGALTLLLAACQTTTTGSLAPGVKGDSRDGLSSSDEASASKRAQVRLELAGAYFARGQLATALEEVKQALSADPNMAPAYNLRGLIYAGMGEPQLAEESYRRALQINPRDADAMHNLGWFMCQQKRYEESEKLFLQALDQPQYLGGPRTLLARGVCQARSGRMAEAEATLTRAYELDAANPAVAVNLAEVLLRRGEYERARFYIRRVNSTPEQVGAGTLWLAARIEKKLGNNQGANEFGREMRERFPQAPETRAFERGQFDE